MRTTAFLLRLVAIPVRKAISILCGPPLLLVTVLPPVARTAPSATRSLTALATLCGVPAVRDKALGERVVFLIVLLQTLLRGELALALREVIATLSDSFELIIFQPWQLLAVRPNKEPLVRVAVGPGGP